MIRKKTDKTGLTPLSELVSLDKKRALITGSGSGIGRAIAYRFAEAGARLELVDINEESLASVEEELEHFNTEINVHRVNLSKKEEIDSLWERLAGKEPGILVNNAGIYPTKPFLDVDESFLKKVMDVNLNSVFWMCQHMIRSRLKKGGVIINTGSIEAVMPLKEDLAHYGISKAGIMVLSRALASEYGKRGFRINVLGQAEYGLRELGTCERRYEVQVECCQVGHRIQHEDSSRKTREARRNCVYGFGSGERLVQLR